MINYLDNVIFEIKSSGLTPVIAHPERYSYVQENPNFVYNLIKNGVLFQANFASITGYYGKSAKKTLIKLLKANMIHFLGSDSHNNKKYDNINECIKVLEKIISKEKLEELTTINPRHILDDEQIKIEEPKLIKRGLFH
jgi:protein-tyrosine phosphatase